MTGVLIIGIVTLMVVAALAVIMVIFQRQNTAMLQGVTDALNKLTQIITASLNPNSEHSANSKAKDKV